MTDQVPEPKVDHPLPVWSAFGRHLNRLVRVKVQLVFPEIALLQIGAFLVVLFRGLDYVQLSATNSPESMQLVEKALSYNTWGWLFITTALLGIIGLHFDRIPLAAIAHGFAFALYAAFSLGSLIEVFSRDDLYGWRTAGGWLFAVLVHWLLADASIDGWKLERDTRDRVKAKNVGWS